MKNLLIILATIISVTASGQNHLLGVRCGPTWSNVASNYFTQHKRFRSEFAAGVTYDYHFKKHFSIGADIFYDQRGLLQNIVFTDNLGNPTGNTATIKFNYDYITMPLKFGFHYGNTAYGFANIGLAPAILIDAKTISPDTYLNGGIQPGGTYNITWRINKADLGGLVEIGGGYVLKERYWLYSSFLYRQSFTTITNPDYFEKYKILHYGMMLNFGVKYNL